MVNINDLTITSIETINAFDKDDKYKFTLDELQSVTIAQTQDTTDITGKAGRKLATLKRNKAVTISGTNGLISGGLMEAQTGSSFEKKSDATVLWVDYLTVGDDNTAKTKYKAEGTSGSEIVELYIKDNDGVSASKKLTQMAKPSDGGGSVAEPESGKYYYDPSTMIIEFNATDVAENKDIVAFYNRNLEANVLENSSDTYSATLKLYVDAIAEDKCSNFYRVQFYIPRADFSGEFSLEMSDSQAVHEFEASALSGACGTAGQFFTYTVFGVDEDGAVA